MKAQFIRGEDPKKSMRIGLAQKWLSLKKGDILKIIKEFITDSQGEIREENCRYHIFTKGDYLQISNTESELFDDGCIGFTAYVGTKTVRSAEDLFIWGTPLQLEKALELVPRIQEAHQFTRGVEPKKSMAIGQTYLDKKFIEETEWWVKYNPALYEIIDFVKDYRGYFILLMSSKCTENIQVEKENYYRGETYYIGTSMATTELGGKVAKTPEKALSKIKDDIDECIEQLPEDASLKETQNFTREGKPIKQMSIGQEHIDQHIIDTTRWALRREMWEDNQQRPFEPNELIRDYKGFPIVVLKDPNIDPKEESNMSAIWIATSTMSYTNWSSSKEYAIRKMKEIIDDLLGRGKISSEINKFKIKHGELVAEKLDFTRSEDPLTKMRIGKNRFPSKMGEGYISLYNDGEWSIEKYFNKNYGEYNLVVVVESEDLNMTDWACMYDDGRIAYDNPYSIPGDIKEMVKHLYHKIRGFNESVNFERGLDPKDSMKIGRVGERAIKKVLDLLVEIRGGEYNIKYLKDCTEGTYLMPPGYDKVFRADNFFIRYYFDSSNSEYHFTYGYRIEGKIMKEKILATAEEGLTEILNHITPLPHG